MSAIRSPWRMPRRGDWPLVEKRTSFMKWPPEGKCDGIIALFSRDFRPGPGLGSDRSRLLARDRAGPARLLDRDLRRRSTERSFTHDRLCDVWHTLTSIPGVETDPNPPPKRPENLV